MPARSITVSITGIAVAMAGFSLATGPTLCAPAQLQILLTTCLCMCRTLPEVARNPESSSLCRKRLPYISGTSIVGQVFAGVEHKMCRGDDFCLKRVSPGSANDCLSVVLSMLLPLLVPLSLIPKTHPRTLEHRVPCFTLPKFVATGNPSSFGYIQNDLSGGLQIFPESVNAGRLEKLLQEDGRQRNFKSLTASSQ